MDKFAFADGQLVGPPEHGSMLQVGYPRCHGQRGSHPTLLFRLALFQSIVDTQLLLACCHVLCPLTKCDLCWGEQCSCSQPQSLVSCCWVAVGVP